MCTVNIYEIIKNEQLKLGDIQNILIKKIDQRYKAPIMFKDGKLLDPMFFKMNSCKDVYTNTFNKKSPNYMKRLECRKFYKNLCKINGWECSDDKPKSKRQVPKNKNKNK